MTELAPNTPVIVGVGFSQEKLDDPQASSEASRLMAKAIQMAAEDAGNADLARELESITVLKGMWEYKNPGKLIADELGCTAAKSILADVGNLQLSALFDLCNAIQKGEQSLGVVVGGEAKFRELRAKITGQEVTSTVQGEDDPDPDVYVGIPDPFATDTEIKAGIFMPVELFAVIESAIRAHNGLSQEEHRDRIAQLYSDFSRIASQNPRAWKQDVVSAESIRNPDDKNAMLAFPYTKKFNSQWNVNQAAALLVCSYEKAKALGLDDSNWVYPIAGAQNRHVVCLAQKKALHSQPGSVLAGEKVYELAGIKAEDVTASDLYSCFPAAVQSWGQDLKLDHLPWSVSGCMAFAGGPYNHASIDTVVRMVDVIRENKTQGKQIGLVSNLSGIFGKHAVVLLSNEARSEGFGFADVTDDVAKIDQPLPTNPDYVGPAKVVGYTVAHINNEPSHAFVYVENSSGERTVVKTMDKELLTDMMSNEYVGREVQTQEDGTFVCA